jgi:hypothetical protein
MAGSGGAKNASIENFRNGEYARTLKTYGSTGYCWVHGPVTDGAYFFSGE